jgi:hypothetical protein
MTINFVNSEDHTSVKTIVGASLAAVVAAFGVTFAAMMGVYEFFEYFTLEKTRHVFLLKEFQTRAFLLLIGVALTAFLLWRKEYRARFLAARWPVVALGLFWIGFVVAQADPFHGLREEGNWGRYTTSTVLILTGLIALAGLFHRTTPILLRILGAGFGALMIAAAFDELFEFHETLVDAAEPAASTSYAAFEQDLPTMMVGIAGIVVLAMLFFGYRWLQRYFEMVWLRRYALSIRFLGAAVAILVVAVGLDSVDTLFMALGQPLLPIYKVAAEPNFMGAANVLLDLDNTFNSVEEVLEYAAGLCFLMMVGSAYSVSVLGFGWPTRSWDRSAVEPVAAAR